MIEEILDFQTEQRRRVFSPMLLSLKARCMESERADALFKDPLAIKAMGRIQYRFSDLEMSWSNQLGVAVRSHLIDQELRKVASSGKGIAVVNLGAGLDTRFARIKNVADWYDLDLPEVIEVRQRLFDGCSLQYIVKSLEDCSWMESVPAGKKFFFIAEGVLAYLPPAVVNGLLARMAERFPGSSLIFSAVSPFMLAKANEHPYAQQNSIVMRWGLETGRELAALSSRIIFMDEWYYLDVRPERWRWRKWLKMFPRFRKAMKVVLIKFAE